MCQWSIAAAPLHATQNLSQVLICKHVFTSQDFQLTVDLTRHGFN